MSNNEVYIVFIFNKRFVRWETFTPYTTIRELFELLHDKYKLDKYIMEIGSIYIKNNLKNRNELLIGFLHPQKNGTIRITTKKPLFSLPDIG